MKLRALLQSALPTARRRSGMHLHYVLWLLAALVWWRESLASSPRTPIVQIAGKGYVRVRDWAEAHDFQARWIKREETIEISNPAARIVLAVDSQEAQINGVQVRLLFPAVLRENQMYVSELDLQTTFTPILFPLRSALGPRVRNICLDPGHGGRDPGNHSGSNQEKKYNLLLAEELRSQLVKNGFKVTLTRTGDNFIDLSDRPQIARQRKADLFISVHFNAFSDPSVHGAEVYCLTPAGAPSTNARGEGGGSGAYAGNRLNAQNILLAYQVQKSLTRNLAVEDRGVHRARFAVLRDAAMPAVLIEGGFMTHPAEGRKIFDPAYRRQMARAIVEGVMAYKKQIERG